MEAHQLSPYVPIDLPCTAEVKAYLQFCLTEEDGFYLPDANTSVGKALLRVFTPKTRAVSKDRIRQMYPETFTIGVRETQLYNIGTVVEDDAVREMNLMVTSILKEQLYRHLQLCLMADENFSIKEGIKHWMDVVGISDDVRNVAAYKRSFTNWRVRNCPELIKNIGRPRKQA